MTSNILYSYFLLVCNQLKRKPSTQNIYLIISLESIAMLAGQGITLNCPSLAVVCHAEYVFIITWYPKKWWVETSRAKTNTHTHPKETGLLCCKQWNRHSQSTGAIYSFVCCALGTATTKISTSRWALSSFISCWELQELLAGPAPHSPALGCTADRSHFVGWDFWAGLVPLNSVYTSKSPL